ncbi:MAG: glycosyltransferase family 4 protein [Pseudomonadota bacterium]
MTRLMTLLPMACDGSGPSYTCTSLLLGLKTFGFREELFAARARVREVGLVYRLAVPSLLNGLPYRYISKPAAQLIEKRFLTSLQEGDIAYLWPAASLSVYETVKKLGLPIFAEGINTRMKYARRILDAAYAAEGLAPTHGITDARIAEEEAKLSMTSAIFAPSRQVELSLTQTQPPTYSVLSASYGVDLRRKSGMSKERAGQSTPPVFLFVGWGTIRKGLHQLLRAWEKARIKGELWIAGSIAPELAELCGPLLARPSVRCLGFVRNVDDLYRRADAFILPSFEEGDPLVTYEAATYGLPIIASPMGAGRMGERTGCFLPVDPTNCESFIEPMMLLADDIEARRHWSQKSMQAVQGFDWTSVAARRSESFRSFIDTQHRI